MRTILCAVIGYFFLLLIVRLLTRRPGAQMTPFEFVLVFLIGGVVILATVGEDHSLTNCVCAILTVGLMHRLVAGIKQRSPRFGAIVDGTPLLLLKHGRWISGVLDRSRMADADVMAAARTKNVRSLDGIEYAVLERNGGISIIEKSRK